MVAQQRLATTAVLRQVDGVDGRAEDAGPAGRQRVREVQTRLPAELDHHTEHRVASEHVAHPLEVEGLEVEAGRGIEVGADRLGVAIDEHAIESRFPQGSRGVHAAVIELDPLADADRARADHRHRRVAGADDLVFVFVGGVVIRGHRLELGGTGIDLTKGRLERRDRQAAAAQLRDPGVVETGTLGPQPEIGVDGAGQRRLERGDVREPVDEPRRIACCHTDLVKAGPVAQRLHRRHQPAVVRLMQQVRTAAQLGGIGKALFQGPQRLAECRFEGPLDRHHLAGRLHLRAQRPVRRGELIERPARDLDDAVVERRLEGRARLPGDGIRDFVQATSRRDLRGDPRDRISRRLRRQRRGAAHSRIHLDDVVPIRSRVQRKLDIAPAFDAQRPDDA